MTKSELTEIYKICTTADGDCSYCAVSLAHKVWKTFDLFTAQEVADILSEHTGSEFSAQAIIDGNLD